MGSKNGMIEESKEQIDWNYILELLDDNDTSKLIKYFETTQQRLIIMADDKGFTLLHHAVLKSRSDLIALLLNYSRET